MTLLDSAQHLDRLINEVALTWQCPARMSIVYLGQQYLHETRNARKADRIGGLREHEVWMDLSLEETWGSVLVVCVSVSTVGNEGAPQAIAPRLIQASLANIDQMSTRSRVSGCSVILTSST